MRLRMDNTSAVAYVNRLGVGGGGGGGDSLSISVQSGSGSVAMGTQSGFLSQCRTSVRPSEYRGRLAVSPLPRLQQLEVMSRGISRSDADPTTLCQRSFRGPTECTVASVFQLVAGPHGARIGWASTSLKTDLRFAALKFAGGD